MEFIFFGWAALGVAVFTAWAAHKEHRCARCGYKEGDNLAEDEEIRKRTKG